MSGGRVLMGHGGGGELARELLDEVILPALGLTPDAAREDAASIDLPPGAGRLALTTDSFVVRPLEFPGGDIGKLSVCGTVNDLAVSGARPLALTLALVIEEGFEIARLGRLLESAAAAARAAGVRIVSGDTKVVEAGSADGLFINTAGVGIVPGGVRVSAASVRPGDECLVSGPLGRHGIAVLSAREGLRFETPVTSDCASLSELCRSALAAGGAGVHAMRDLTRGGAAAALNEIATASGVAVEIDEAAIPEDQAVAGACAMLGLDPLGVANEGTLALFCGPAAAAPVLEAMRSTSEGRYAARVGRVLAGRRAQVLLRTRSGGRRILDMPHGEGLPRIC